MFPAKCNLNISLTISFISLHFQTCSSACISSWFMLWKFTQMLSLETATASFPLLPLNVLWSLSFAFSSTPAFNSIPPSRLSLPPEVKSSRSRPQAIGTVPGLVRLDWGTASPLASWLLSLPSILPCHCQQGNLSKIKPDAVI